jgi:hypothetical protein
VEIKMQATERTQRILSKILDALAEEFEQAHPLDYLKEFVLACEAVFYAFAKGFGLPGPTIEVLLQAMIKDVILRLRIEAGAEVTEKDFLDAYFALCKGFGFYIGSCGCCDSPFLNEVEGDREWTILANDSGDDVKGSYNDLAGHEAHLRGLSCLNCDNGGCYVKAQYGTDGKILCAECGKELDG